MITYLCDFLCFIDLFSELLYLKRSVFLFTVVLDFVTCVLALCRDGLKQMSDLPFFLFFLNWRINCDIRSRWLTVQLPVNMSSAGAGIFCGDVFNFKDCLWQSLGQLMCHHTYSDESCQSEWDCWPDIVETEHTVGKPSCFRSSRITCVSIVNSHPPPLHLIVIHISPTFECLGLTHSSDKISTKTGNKWVLLNLV